MRQEGCVCLVRFLVHRKMYTESVGEGGVVLVGVL